jgi:uridine phosphorylase
VIKIRKQMEKQVRYFPETELILTPENKVYHINLCNDDIADDVIVVGDQGRVAQISRHFSTIDFKTEHREFITHTGTYKGKRITVLSTGIGPDNIDIVLNELDAAVNIDLVSRTEKEVKRKLNIIRLGTSGSLQADIPVNGLVVSEYGLGIDGILNFYEGWERVTQLPICDAFVKHTEWTSILPYPYCIKADRALFEKFSPGNYHGITTTAPGFYGPQGRQLRLRALKPDLNEKLTSFKHEGLRITNFEMETSALYGLGAMLGHRCLTICVVIANRVTKKFTANYSESVDLLISQCLQRLTS